MGDVLLVTDADWLFDEVVAALADGETRINRVRDGHDAIEAAGAVNPDLVILDLQTGTKGGVATCIDLRLEEGSERLPRQKVLLLLDRDADRWLARTAGADGWMIKPVDPFRLRKASQALLAGDSWFEGEPTPATTA